MNYIFIASKENSHGRIMLHYLIKNGFYPTAVFLGGNKSIISNKYSSLIRYFNKHGFINTIWRIKNRAFRAKKINNRIKNDNKFLYSIKSLCIENNITIHYFDNINNNNYVSAIKNYAPDVIILGGAPLIKKRIFDLPKIAILNAHPALLPDVRGVDVVEHSVLNNIPFGMTIFKIDDGIDTGQILLKKRLRKSFYHNFYQVRYDLEILCGKSMVKSLNKIRDGKAIFKNQKIKKNSLFTTLSRDQYLRANELLKKRYLE